MFEFLKRNPLVYLPRKLWEYGKEDRKRIVLYVALSIGSMVIDLTMPFLVGGLMNDVQRRVGDGLSPEIVIRVVAICLISIAFWTLHGPSRLIEQAVAVEIRGRILLRSFRKVLALPVRWHVDSHSGETIERLNRAATALHEFAEDSFMPLRMAVRYIVAIVVLWYFSPLAGAIMTVATVLIGIEIVFFDKVVVKLLDVVNTHYARLNASVQDYLTNVMTVISLRLEERVTHEVTRRFSALPESVRRVNRTAELKWAVADSIMSIAFLGTVLSYIYTRKGQIEAGTFYALYEYLRIVDRTLMEFNMLYGRLMEKAVRVQAIEPYLADFEKLVAPTAPATLPRDWKEVAIRGLRFQHATKRANGVKVSIDSLVLKRGRSVAFVGLSGSGKSTTLALMRGLYEAEKCKVFCDGEELPHGLAHIAHQVTLIPQDPEIFAETVRFNVTLGVEASDESVLKAVRRAQFMSVLTELPEGLETRVAEKGVSLSGGESQRLALARGFFFLEEARSDLLLLDEPTSSVDPFNERQIYEELLSRKDGRCIVSALHKLHLLPLFDDVVIFSKGSIIEVGSVSELRAGKLNYSNYYTEHIGQR